MSFYILQLIIFLFSCVDKFTNYITKQQQGDIIFMLSWQLIS